MAKFINDNCVSCGACSAECPCEAIEMGDTKYVVDADKCIDCNACVGACPSDAIEDAN